MNKQILKLAALLMVMVPMGVTAVPVIIGGKLVGATDVTVNGTLYDVSFVDGSCVELFGGCDDTTDFEFQTMEDARSASQALMDQVFLTGTLIDTQPNLTNGCENSYECSIGTPIFNEGSIWFSMFINSPVVSPGNRLKEMHLSTLLIIQSTDGWPLPTNAVWSQTNDVAEPGTLALLGLGLGGMGFCRKRQRRQAIAV